ncbi:MAG: glycosyltransferase family 2 protein [Pirellulales bacterium]|nr:glycosyltransferase family 2 protein [Planctomycetales bacterium]
MDVSLIVPVYNEVDNVRRLHAEVSAVFEQLDKSYEIIYVDDGSSDGSTAVLAELARQDPRVRVVVFRRNFGQTAAMNAGIHLASGDAVVTIDADLQNDPADIPMMLEALGDDCDLVHGWRRDRQDALVSRRVPSVLANRLISWVTGFPVHDLGCTLKVMRREIAQDIELYGEMHRFIPVLAHWRGARCREVVTNHRARQFGTSKYGITRTLRVVLDLITVKYMIQYMTSPMKLFGMIGLTSGAAAAVAGAATLAMKLRYGVDMTGNPLLLLTVLALIMAGQFFVLGMLGELNVRTYYESQGKHPYAIRRLLNFDPWHPENAATASRPTGRGRAA